MLVRRKHNSASPFGANSPLNPIFTHHLYIIRHSDSAFQAAVSFIIIIINIIITYLLNDIVTSSEFVPPNERRLLSRFVPSVLTVQPEM
jgi:hypothetical protein